MPSPEAIGSALGYLHARNAVNEGIRQVVAQRRAGVELLNPQVLREGVTIAEVRSQALTRSIGILATRPPYRDSREALTLDDDMLEEAVKLAVASSGVIEAAHEIGRAMYGIDHIIVSKSGALAVFYDDESCRLTDDDYDLLQTLDDGNAHVNIDAYGVEIGG